MQWQGEQSRKTKQKKEKKKKKKFLKIFKVCPCEILTCFEIRLNMRLRLLEHSARERALRWFTKQGFFLKKKKKKKRFWKRFRTRIVEKFVGCPALFDVC
jgi:hypothetical protein